MSPKIHSIRFHPSLLKVCDGLHQTLSKRKLLRRCLHEKHRQKQKLSFRKACTNLGGKFERTIKTIPNLETAQLLILSDADIDAMDGQELFS